jgi:glyoxylase-like metal-dependent hydrolase (beta-lactamase superfamily II)
MQKIAPDLYVEAFPGVTVGAFVTPAGVLCIDTPTHPADARRWRQKLAQVTNAPITYVVNLDHHRDRILGNQWFDAPVIAHEYTSDQIRQWPEVFKGGPSEAGADADLAVDLVGVRIVAPQITLSDHLTLILGGQEIRISAHPGPTLGALWVELPKAKITFVGDTITHADKASTPPFLGEANLPQWLEALTELRKPKYPATLIVPGRGLPLDKKGLKPMDDFLKLVKRKLEGLIKAKKTRLEAGALAEDMLTYFDTPHALRDHYTRRLRVGLERLFDAYALSQ